MSELHVIDLEGDDSDDSHLYTRHTAAVRGNISLIVQGSRLIAVACAQHGVSLFDYELKPVAGASPLMFQGSGPGAGARQSYGRNTLSVNGERERETTTTTTGNARALACVLTNLDLRIFPLQEQHALS